VRKMAIFASICAGLGMSGARAVDLSITGYVSQSIEANSNYLMLPTPNGPTYLPVSTVVLDALARTPTMRMAATADWTYRQFLGPGGELLLPALDRGFRGSFEKYENLGSYKIEGATRTQQAQQLQLAETGVATVGGDVITNWIEGGFKRQLSYVDQITTSVRATSLDFTAPGSTPSFDLTSTGTWTHRINPLTDITAMVQNETINYDNSAGSSSGGGTNVTIWRGTLGVNSRLTRSLSFSGAAGVVDLTLVQGGGAASIALPVQVTTGQLASGSALDWIANMTMTYEINRNNTLLLAASQSVGPDSLGLIRKFDLAGIAFTHRINHAATLLFTGDFSHQPSTVGTTDLYSAAATYDYEVARDWHTSFSYRFRQRTGSFGDAESHAFFASIRYDFTILPSATAQPPAPTRSDVGSLLSWPAAWIRPWRDASWQR